MNKKNSLTPEAMLVANHITDSVFTKQTNDKSDEILVYSEFNEDNKSSQAVVELISESAYTECVL